MDKVQELQHLSLATTYEVDNTFDSEKFIKMRLRVCHDGTNPNKSNFKVEDMENAEESIKNIPILANVIVDENGELQFGGHDMVLEPHKMQEGEYKLIYKEVPIGLVPETCNHTIEKFNNKNYVFCDCYLWKEYSGYAQDIIERDKNIKISMEILVDEYSYNAKEKVYNITDYRYQGITFLNKDFGTGMKDALATTGQFSEDDSKDKFIIMMQELKETLNLYNINNKKGGSMMDEAIKDLLSQYNVEIETLSFDIEGMSIEEIENKLKELFNDTSDQDQNQEPEKYIKSFELSHSDVRYALYQLLTPIENEDSEWYFIDKVYDDRFEYVNWEGTKIFRQGYKKDGDIVSFENDRVELFQERLTEEEKEVLDKMRSNYSILEARLNEFEQLNEQLQLDNNELSSFKTETLQAQRTELETEIFAKYDEIIEPENESYKAIKETKSNFSIEQLEEKLAVIFARKQIQFSSNKNKIIKLGGDSGNTGEVSPYGNMFEKHQININKEEN